MEYWLVDVETGNAQGCYESIDDALEAIELEARDRPTVDRLTLLAMRTQVRQHAAGQALPEQRAFVQLRIGLSEG